LIVQGLLLSLLAGLATGLGGLIVLLIQKPSRRTLDLILGLVSGMMMTIAFVSLIPHAMELAGMSLTSLGFAAGSILLLIVDRGAPHANITGLLDGARGSPDKLQKGLVTSIGIAMHNVPEGLAVASSFTIEPSLGLLVALVVGAHNIPEGLVSAIPLRQAGVRGSKILLITLLSGLAEPAAAALALFLLQEVSHSLLAFWSAFAAGAMIYITVDELIPEIDRRGGGHAAVLGITSGVLAALLLMSLI